MSWVTVIKYKGMCCACVLCEGKKLLHVSSGNKNEYAHNDDMEIKKERTCILTCTRYGLILHT
jgi:hypothetical protein